MLPFCTSGLYLVEFYLSFLNLGKSAFSKSIALVFSPRFPKTELCQTSVFALNGSSTLGDNFLRGRIYFAVVTLLRLHLVSLPFFTTTSVFLLTGGWQCLWGKHRFLAQTLKQDFLEKI